MYDIGGKCVRGSRLDQLANIAYWFLTEDYYSEETSRMVLGTQHCQQKTSVIPLKSVFERINDPTGYLATEQNCQLHEAFLH